VAVASAWLYHMIYSSNVLITYIILSITLILTHTPDCMKMEERFLVTEPYRVVH